MDTFRSTVSAWPASSNAITTTPAPKSRMRRACSRKVSSPSLRLIELTTPLPCTHFRPASSTLQRELSIMIGMRATSGSVAIRFRNEVMACTPSSRSASMLTSSRFAPPRTCSIATSEAAWLSPASMRRRNRAEPDTLVRSPIMTNPVSGPISNGSSPLNRLLTRAAGTVRRASPDTPCAIWRMCSGPVPQQPPTMLTKPPRAKSCSSPAVSCGCWSYPPKAFGKPALG